MNELDEAWSQMLDGALASARASGREDVADFLALKRSNDLIRKASVDWLFSSLIEIASEKSREVPALVIEREGPHEFPWRGATLAGELLRVRLGVRSMTVEAGWTRTPSHGFMRGGALAGARIVHFGMPKAGVELALKTRDEVPVWCLEDGDEFDSHGIVAHFRIFVGE